MDIIKVPQEELTLRMNRFKQELDRTYEGWELCAIIGGVNMYYLTGTICDGMLLINRQGGCILWARRSYERAVLESALPDIRPMRSFRDVAEATGKLPDTIYLDTSAATLEWYGMLTRYMPFKSVLPVDKVMLKTRAVKSSFELERMRRAGTAVNHLLTEKLPPLLRGGMTETELATELYSLSVKLGYHGLSRFSTRNSDMILGHICFAESPLYPSVFNGASGIAGICPAAPVVGNPGKVLNKGDLIYIDIGFGVDGYHADRTLVYSFNSAQPKYIEDAHRHCLELERLAASMLRPGAVPSEIYKTVLAAVEPELRGGFMGVPGRTVPFLGHSVGLYIDETPVLASGFDEPLESGMAIAIEPKIGFPGVGMVGSENTYLVTESGGNSITGQTLDILQC